MTRILHFGMPKTGSSSVHRTMLYVDPATGLRYLHDHGINLSRALATVGMENPEEFSANRRRAISPEDLKKQKLKLRKGIEKGLADTSARHVVLSAEMLTGLDKPALMALGEWLKGVAPDLVVAGYVRDPYSFVDSMFQTAVRNGRGKFDVSAHYPRYFKRFRKMEQAFGRKSVRYFNYAPENFVNGDVVNDFAAKFDIDASGWKVIRTNVSLSRDAVAMLYMYRKLGPKEPRGDDAVRATVRFMRQLESLKGPKARLSSKLVMPLMEQNAEDIAWMDKRLEQPMKLTAREDDPLAITAEEDLMQLSDAAFEWLKALDIDISRLGTPAQPNAQGVSDALETLYQRAFHETADKKPRPLQPTI